MHSRLESLGKRHKCAFNYVSNHCECKCWYAEHYLSEMPDAPAINFERDNYTWKNLVFHEAATGSSEDPAWKLLHETQKYDSIGYTHAGGMSGHQKYWNKRNSNGH